MGAEVWTSCAWIRSRRAEEDRPSLHLSEGVRPQAPARRQAVQVGVPAVHAGAPNPAGDWQGEEPRAQRRRTLRGAAAVLRPEGDELLHSPLRSVQSSGCDCFPRLGQGPGSSSGATKVHVHTGPEEAGRRLNAPVLLVPVLAPAGCAAEFVHATAGLAAVT